MRQIWIFECETTAAFPEDARSPVSYGPRARAIVTYLLSRQHIPNRRVVEAMRDLFGEAGYQREA